MKALTFPTDKEFCDNLAKQINKNHTGCAEVLPTGRGYVVAVTQHYYNACKLYVQKHCRIKPE